MVYSEVKTEIHLVQFRLGCKPIVSIDLWEKPETKRFFLWATRTDTLLNLSEVTRFYYLTMDPFLRIGSPKGKPDTNNKVTS